MACSAVKKWAWHWGEGGKGIADLNLQLINKLLQICNPDSAQQLMCHATQLIIACLIAIAVNTLNIEFVFVHLGPSNHDDAVPWGHADLIQWHAGTCTTAVVPTDVPWRVYDGSRWCKSHVGSVTYANRRQCRGAISWAKRFTDGMCKIIVIVWNS